MPAFFVLSLTFSILLCMHALRTGQAMYWFSIILFFQPLGGVVYLLFVVIPELFKTSGARRRDEAARQAHDPQFEYGQALAACEAYPTVRNQTRLAVAATALGRHEEAEQVYGRAAQGIYAEDPALLLGRANALIELGQYEAARALLERLGENVDSGRTPAAALSLGRANAGLGRLREAETAFTWAVERMPGFEASSRYAAFLAGAGRREEAQEIVVDMGRRIDKLNQHFRKEAQAWRDQAAAAVGAPAFADPPRRQRSALGGRGRARR